MLYGTDYRSVTEQDESRLLRRFRRDVMFVKARPQEVLAAGLIAGLAVMPVLLVCGSLLTVLFSLVFSGAATAGPLPAGDGLVDPTQTATSRTDLVLAVLAATAVLTLAGGLAAALRRFDSQRKSGLQFYLHHPRSALGLVGFFAPVTALTVVGLLMKAAESPHPRRAGMIVATPSLLDRGVLYTFLGVVLSMLLYLVWEACFPRILPTLSELDVDAEVARYQREDRARIGAEEDAIRARATGGWRPDVIVDLAPSVRSAPPPEQGSGVRASAPYDGKIR